MKNAKDRQKLAWEGIFYSVQRIDFLIVSICGAGIYICLETIKYLTEKDLIINCLVKVSGVLFLLGIVINFISQVYGRKANEQDFLMCEAEIKAGKKISESEEAEINEYDQSAEKYSKITRILNFTSMLFMFFGLSAIVSFFIFIF